MGPPESKRRPGGGGALNHDDLAKDSPPGQAPQLLDVDGVPLRHDRAELAIPGAPTRARPSWYAWAAASRWAEQP